MAQATAVEDQFKALQERTDGLEQQLNAMIRISSLIARNVGTEEILREILDVALALFEASCGSIMLADRSSKYLQIKEARGLDQSIISETKLPVGEGIAGWVAENCEPVLLINGIDDPRFIREKEDRGIKDAMSVPLCIEKNVLGVLSLSNSATGKEFTNEDLKLLSAFGHQAGLHIHRSQYIERLNSSYIELVSALSKIVDARDPYTFGHARAVRDYSMGIAEHLNLSREDLNKLNIAALLHDVGKIGIRDEILLKPKALTIEEYKVIQTHPSIGARIVETVPYLRNIAPVVRHHHERYDGAGYPSQLKGHEIPLGARILAIADAFDSMASDRPYRKALPIETILSELKKGRNKQFDGELLEIFLKAFNIKQDTQMLKEVVAKEQTLYHDQIRFSLYDMLTEPEPGESKESIAVISELVENLLKNLQKFIGGRAALFIENTINEFATDNGLPYFVRSGKMLINIHDTRMANIIKSFEGYYDYLLHLIAMATGSKISDYLAAEALELLGEDKRDIYSSMFA